MCSYIIIIMIKKKLKSILKKNSWVFCFSMWIMIHFQLQMFLKWKNDRQLWNLNFPGWTHDDDYWPARENSKWYIFKKPRFGTFQSIMDHFLCEIIARKNINLWKKRPHTPAFQNHIFCQIFIWSKKKKK